MKMMNAKATALIGAIAARHPGAACINGILAFACGLGIACALFLPMLYGLGHSC